ncbi:predicted protein [Naegleria gruberi]|uniref:Predicted protein n=1 Tax=Naegleria gruberi TaxID=5762 RepID=D2VVK9_NAEGR|nr:uncharacterized protein NAEGRDRAFT_73055 [Naegleria gruberi]EFC39054.1 predicted protein [Naegleria gruberi]|eukprot:XP_002671798.1 predicted protein [Naegleria gruberi strain NEG-M]
MSAQQSHSGPVQLFLDLDLSSPLLIHQLRDVPSSLKYHVIMLPINNAFQLTIDQYSGYEIDHGILFSDFSDDDYGKFAHLISKRDLRYISKQIMKLNNYELLVSIAVKLNLWNEKKFVL